MPVRCTIHSSSVATTVASSLFVSTREGRAEPVPAIRTPRRGISGNLDIPAGAVFIDSSYQPRPPRVAGQAEAGIEPIWASSSASRSTIASLKRASQNARLLRIADLMVLATDEPCAITQMPLTPSSGAPPYSW
jgi:hypothetical protein